MLDRQALARLRIEPCGITVTSRFTITLVFVKNSYWLEVVEHDPFEKKRKRQRLPVNKSEVDSQFEFLKRSTLPAFPISPLVCDGTYYELMVEGFCSTLTLGWWTAVPEGAEAFSNFADWLEDSAQLNCEEDSVDTSE